MVVPTLRHRIAIRLARGMQLSSAEQADVSTCSGVVRLLLLSLPPRKPSGIGLLWVVGRKFLFLFFFPPCVPCDPLMFPLVHSLSNGFDWSVKFSALYIWLVLDDLMSSTTSFRYQIQSTGFFSWKICWRLFGYPSVLLVILGAVPYLRASWRIVCFFFLSSGNLWGEPDWCMGIRLCCFCDFIIFWVGFGIWNRWLIFVDGIVMLLMVHLVLCLLVWTSAVLWRTNFVPLLASKMVMVSLERNLLGEWYSIAFTHSYGWELTSKLFSTWRL